jgi:hypothetical protein
MTAPGYETFVVTVWSNGGTVLAERVFTGQNFTAVVEFAQGSISVDSEFADEGIAYTTVFWDGTHVDTLTPEWLSIPEIDDDYEISEPSPEMEEAWDSREDFHRGYVLD